MELEGTFIVELFYSAKNNFRICKINTNDESMTISGYFNELEKNVPYIFEGEYVNHKKYGKQFSVINVKVNTSNKEGIISYFSSNLFSGIGLAMAGKIYKFLGDDAVSKILNDKTVLYEIMNEQKANNIYEVLVENEGLNQVMIDLNNLGLTNKEAIKAYEKFGLDVVGIVKANPYELISVDGMGFRKCDQIAINLGIEETSEFRIEAIIIYIIESYCFKSGNAYMYEDELIYEVLRFLNYSITESILKEVIAHLINEGRIVFDRYYYINEIYYSEINLANKLNNMNSTNKVSKKHLDTLIRLAEGTLVKEFDDEQKSAIENAINNQISIISGGPGVGKTTIINAIIIVLKELYSLDLEKNDLMLMAPTGKASRRMMETLNVKATTIHKALGYSEGNEFEYDEDNKLPCRFLILDEVSMLDIFIANKLFSALHDDTKVILVGDVNQLPSVNVGNVLADLIDSNLFNVTYLNQIYRQSKRSGIVRLSKMILDGNITPDVYDCEDVRKLDIAPNMLFEGLKKEIEYYLDLGYKFKDIVVLAPLYRSNVGIDEINKFLQSEYNKSKTFIEYNDIIFKVGDKVIQLKNNSDKNISNGDTGIIKSIINDKDIRLYVDIDSVIIEYKYEDLNELALAYSLSVHKAQGSEYKVIIAPMFKSYSIMLKKKLFYTCITRAKERLSILTDNESINIAINSIEEARRSTLLNKLSSNELIIDGFKFKEIFNDNITPYDFLED